MDDLIASTICGGSALVLLALMPMAMWRQNAQRASIDDQVLQSRCGELEALLHGVRDDRNRLALRVVELERYLVPYANLLKELAANDRAFATLQHENADLRKRLDGARVLVLALAARAGVRVDQDLGNGQWGVV